MNNEEKILELLSQMQADMTDMKSDMSGVKADISGLKDDMSGVKETLKEHGERLDRMDQRLDQLDGRSQRTAVLLETEVTRKLDLLYEGHGAIMEALDKLAPKSRVEVLEGDVALLKDVVKLMRQEIADLKKAQ